MNKEEIGGKNGQRNKIKYLDILVSRTDAFLERTEAVRIAHLAELHGNAAAQASEDAGRNFSCVLEDGLGFLESAINNKSI